MEIGSAWTHRQRGHGKHGWPIYIAADENLTAQIAVSLSPIGRNTYSHGHCHWALAVVVLVINLYRVCRHGDDTLFCLSLDSVCTPTPNKEVVGGGWRWLDCTRLITIFYHIDDVNHVAHAAAILIYPLLALLRLAPAVGATQLGKNADIADIDLVSLTSWTHDSKAKGSTVGREARRGWGD